jgi:hypothetical protein
MTETHRLSVLSLLQSPLATKCSLGTPELYWLFSKSGSKLCYGRRSVGQSALVSSTHLGLVSRLYFSAWQLRVCWFGAPSLTRGRVCRLQLLLAASAVIFESESRRTRGHILLSQIRDFGDHSESESASYVTTDCQPASLSWNKAPIWGYRQIFTIVWQMRVCWFGAPSDERTGLPFAVATGPRQRSHFRVRVP